MLDQEVVPPDGGLVGDEEVVLPDDGLAEIRMSYLITVS